MSLINLANKLSKYCQNCENIECIYETLTNSNLKDVLSPFSPVKIIKLVFYIDQILMNKKPENITNELEHKLYIFNIVNFSNDDMVPVGCKTCHQSGIEDCNECYGTGSETCWTCGGLGHLDDDERCDECWGDGHVECSLCLGQKTFDCSDCKGAGSIGVKGVEFDILTYITYNSELISKFENVKPVKMAINSLTNESTFLIDTNYFDADDLPSVITSINTKYVGHNYLLSGEYLDDDFLYKKNNKILIPFNSRLLEIIEEFFTN